MHGRAPFDLIARDESNVGPLFRNDLVAQEPDERLEVDCAEGGEGGCEGREGFGCWNLGEKNGQEGEGRER